MLVLALFLQLQTPDTIRPAAVAGRYSTPALRDFITIASIQNRVPPAALGGYKARVETELALILRDSLGRELVGQIEQFAANAEWDRGGSYEMHVLGYRSQTVGAPYSALTWTRMWTTPTLYGNRLALGMNDGITSDRTDSTAIRNRRKADSTAGRPRYRVVHPLSVIRDNLYSFSGGDTVATVYSLGRAIRLVRVHVNPIAPPDSNVGVFRGELDFDAERKQLVRMRGRLITLTTRKNPLLLRTAGAVAVAFIEFENAEISGRYWLPSYQRSEFQAQMGLLGDVRPIYRIVSRFRNYTIVGRDSVAIAESMDTLLAPTRSKLTYAAKDSVSHFAGWDAGLGTESAKVGPDDFMDLAPDVWKPTGPPRFDYWPRSLEDVVHYDKIEGLFTGATGSVKFRDLAPGLSARALVGYAWSEKTLRGYGTVALARGLWFQSVRAGRELELTNDFKGPLEDGLSIGPLIEGIDQHDYLDRSALGYNLMRVIGDVDRASISQDISYVSDRPVYNTIAHAFFHDTAFEQNRNAFPGRYGRFTTTFEYHPRVTGESVSPGMGARMLYELALGQLRWQRLDATLSTRRYLGNLALGARVDGGVVWGGVIPPQTLYELGGIESLTGYRYKEFGGDRAAQAKAFAHYIFPVLRAPRRVWFFVVPGISPGIGGGIQGGWAEASTPAARQAVLALGGDGITPLSRPTERIRATANVALTFLSGVVRTGYARAIDHDAPWKFFFAVGGGF